MQYGNIGYLNNINFSKPEEEHLKVRTRDMSECVSEYSVGDREEYDKHEDSRLVTQYRLKPTLDFFRLGHVVFLLEVDVNYIGQIVYAYASMKYCDGAVAVRWFVNNMPTYYQAIMYVVSRSEFAKVDAGTVLKLLFKFNSICKVVVCATYKEKLHDFKDQLHEIGRFIMGAHKGLVQLQSK